MKELTLVEALCLLKTGWANSYEKALFDIARNLVEKESERLHLEYQIDAMNQVLEKLKKL